MAKTLAAQFTFVRLFPSVNCFMLSKVSCLAEALPTMFTFIRLFTSVDSFVSLGVLLG